MSTDLSDDEALFRGFEALTPSREESRLAVEQTRRRLIGRQIDVHGAGLLFHHHKLLRTRGLPPDRGLRQKPCSSSGIANAARRAQKIRRPRWLRPL